MEEGAQDDEDVPDAVVIRVFGFSIVEEEIDASSVGNAFEHNQENGPEVDALTHRGNDEENGPSEQHIYDQGGLGKAVEKEDLEEDAG